MEAGSKRSQVHDRKTGMHQNIPIALTARPLSVAVLTRHALGKVPDPASCEVGPKEAGYC